MGPLVNKSFVLAELLQFVVGIVMHQRRCLPIVVEAGVPVLVVHLILGLCLSLPEHTFVLVVSLVHQNTFLALLLVAVVVVVVVVVPVVVVFVVMVVVVVVVVMS